METHAVQHLVLVTTLLLLIAAAVAAGVKRIKLPYTVSLVITGAVLAICGHQAAEAKLISSSLLDGIELTPGIVLYVLLPILIFDAAFNLDSRRLLKNLLPIVTLAVPAVHTAHGTGRPGRAGPRARNRPGLGPGAERDRGLRRGAAGRLALHGHVPRVGLLEFRACP